MAELTILVQLRQRRPQVEIEKLLQNPYVFAGHSNGKISAHRVLP